jgi:hypothetical protein
MGFYMGRLGEVHYVLTDAQRFAMEMSKRVDASNQFLAVAMLGSASIGAGAALAPVAATTAVRVGATATGRLLGATGGTGVVIGKFSDAPNYIETAKAMGANYFNLGQRGWNFFQHFGQGWTVNRAFLDASIARGQQVFSSSSTASATGSFAQEVEYLRSKGISIISVVLERAVR